MCWNDVGWTISSERLSFALAWQRRKFVTRYSAAFIFFQKPKIRFKAAAKKKKKKKKTRHTNAALGFWAALLSVLQVAFCQINVAVVLFLQHGPP